MNKHAGFWSEVFGYHDPSCKVSPTIVVISDVFDVELIFSSKDSV